MINSRPLTAPKIQLGNFSDVTDAMNILLPNKIPFNQEKDCIAR